MAEFIPTWADAIARFEGFYSPGSRPARNHNPGDLKFAGQPGAVGKDSLGFAVFPDDPTGFQALYNQLNKYVREFPGYSILQIMAHYLGQSTPTSDAEGNAFTYADTVAGELGVAVSTTLGELAAGITVGDAGGDQSGSGGSDGAPDTGQLLVLLAAGALFFWAISRGFGG